MTSANRSSEPIAYEDSDALQHLSAIADAFLIGERPIARRVDDSVARAGVLRTGHTAPLARLCTRRRRRDPKRAPHSGFGRRSQKHHHARRQWTGLCQPAHRRSRRLPILARLPGNHRRSRFHVRSRLVRICSWCMTLTRNMPPPFMRKASQPAKQKTVQHHRAHIASVLAERGEWDKRVIGVSIRRYGLW